LGKIKSLADTQQFCKEHNYFFQFQCPHCAKQEKDHEAEMEKKLADEEAQRVNTDTS